MIMGFFKDIGRPVLSDHTIMKYNKKGLLIEQPINENQLQPNSVDLTLGNTFSIIQQNCWEPGGDPNHIVLVQGDDGKAHREYLSGVVDTKKEINYINGTFQVRPLKEILWHPSGKPENIPFNPDEKWIEIKPGQFILLASQEILNIPNGIIAFIQGRSSIARLGIQTEQAGLIDAGFRGTITFEVFNQTEHSIILYAGQRIAQVYFFKAQYADKIYGITHNSKYSGQIVATGSKIFNDK